MFHAITGRIVERMPGEVILEAGGIEYQILVSLTAYEQLTGREEARLLLREVITETSHTLYGFATRAERSLFELLLQVNKVGPKLAIRILSALPPDQISSAIAAGDVLTLTRIKGLGKKIAELIVTTLRDSVSKIQVAAGDGTSPQPPRGPTADAIAALLRLGYRRPEAEKAVAAAASDLPDDSENLEALIMAALRAL